MSAYRDITIERGTRFEESFLFRDTGDDSYMPLTGYQWQGQIRASYDSDVALAQFQFAVQDYEDPDTNVVYPDAELLYWLDRATTQALPTGTYVYDIEYDPPAGDEYRDRLVRGRVIIRSEATR